MIFDLTKHYGFYDLCELNLKGYHLILNLTEVLNHYKNNYFSEIEVFKIEKYSSFLFRICISYLKDLSFV